MVDIVVVAADKEKAGTVIAALEALRDLHTHQLNMSGYTEEERAETLRIKSCQGMHISHAPNVGAFGMMLGIPTFDHVRVEFFPPRLKPSDVTINEYHHNALWGAEHKLGIIEACKPYLPIIILFHQEDDIVRTQLFISNDIRDGLKKLWFPDEE